MVGAAVDDSSRVVPSYRGHVLDLPHEGKHKPRLSGQTLHLHNVEQLATSSSLFRWRDTQAFHGDNLFDSSRISARNTKHAIIASSKLRLQYKHVYLAFAGK